MKKILAFLLAAATALTMTACGGSAGSVTQKPEPITDVPAEVVIGGKTYSTELKQLDLRSKKLTDEDIVNIKYMVNLEDLDLGYNQITDISPIAGLENLKSLDLYNNQISDISALTWLTNLEELVMGENNISNISALSGLTKLTKLSMGNNNISDLSPLAGLTNLTELSAQSCQISDVSALAGLTNLTYLRLGYNNISDHTVFLALADNLDSLLLEGNPVCDDKEKAKELDKEFDFWAYQG